ncbi:hypothetical protein Trydic_g7674 [Trypoxylus dichotomus]
MFYPKYQILLLSLLLLCVHGDQPQVNTKQGTLKGSTRTNIDGGLYYSFQNIPYGKPPIDELRFKNEHKLLICEILIAPQPADSWEGIRDATQDLPQCTQAYLGTTSITGQEDCLYLNVYTPELPSANITQKAVMFFIYGGAFTSGSAVESNYGSEFLLTKDVVLVVANYRVGLFGFLSLDDANLGISGNAGLKDQVMALKWVKENIEQFGGDPNNILIFGESAGAASVHLHILSQSSKGLFSKAIAESGTAFLMPYNGVRNSGVLLAKALDIDVENWNQMLKELQNQTAESIFFAEQSLTAVYTHISAPIVERTSDSESFISDNPLDIIKSGNYNHVPFIIGVNDAEGLLLQLVSRLTTGESVLITDFTAYIPPDLKIESGSKEEELLIHKIKFFYYGEEEPNRDNITGAVNLHTDYQFAFPAYRAALEHLTSALNPIYFYYFTVDAGLNYAKKLDDTTAIFPGAAHADELGYLFQNLLTPTEIGRVEDVILRNMVNLWTNFAKYGRPTINIENYTWEPINENRFNYLHIETNSIQMEVNPRPQNIKFWSSIYEEYFVNK